MSEQIPASAASNTFERIKRVNASGAAFWSARKLARVLEYSNFRNFLAVIGKAREACANSGHAVADHFVDITEMVVEVATYRISRRAPDRQPNACERIKARAIDNGFDAVIRTVLGCRFKEGINAPFSPAAAVLCLRGLPDPQKESALEYVRNAPPEVMSPVRRAVRHRRLSGQ